MGGVMPFREYLNETLMGPHFLCGNVRKFSIAENGCAHRFQHTRARAEFWYLGLFDFQRFLSLKI